MQLPELIHAPWTVSSFSNGNGGNNCVEVAVVGEVVAVRDSKDRTGPALIFTAAEWAAFLSGVWAGEFGSRPP